MNGWLGATGSKLLLRSLTRQTTRRTWNRRSFVIERDCARGWKAGVGGDEHVEDGCQQLAPVGEAHRRRLIMPSAM